MIPNMHAIGLLERGDLDEREDTESSLAYDSRNYPLSESYGISLSNSVIPFAQPFEPQ